MSEITTNQTEPLARISQENYFGIGTPEPTEKNATVFTATILVGEEAIHIATDTARLQRYCLSELRRQTAQLHAQIDIEKAKEQIMRTEFYIGDSKHPTCSAELAQTARDNPQKVGLVVPMDVDDQDVQREEESTEPLLKFGFLMDPGYITSDTIESVERARGKPLTAEQKIEIARQSIEGVARHECSHLIGSILADQGIITPEMAQYARLENQEAEAQKPKPYQIAIPVLTAAANTALVLSVRNLAPFVEITRNTITLTLAVAAFGLSIITIPISETVKSLKRQAQMRKIEEEPAIRAEKQPNPKEISPFSINIEHSK